MLQGASKYMQEYIEIFDELLDRILAHEVDETIGTPCSCGIGHRTIRCNDCFQCSSTCEACFVRLHNSLPLHWAERWTGLFFERCDISQLGHVITLGHQGAPCKNSTPIRFIVTDCNGIHETKVAFCGCIGAGSHVDQLMSAGIFPGTVKKPSSGFTFGLLKDFHLQTLESKKSAYDFIAALRRRTNNAFPSKVPVSSLYYYALLLLAHLFSFRIHIHSSCVSYESGGYSPW